jgi:hypothetical protein
MTALASIIHWFKIKSAAVVLVLLLWFTSAVIQPFVMQFTQPRSGYTILAFGNPNKLVPSLYNGFHLKFYVRNQNLSRKKYELVIRENSRKLETIRFELAAGRQKSLTRVIWKLPPGIMTLTLSDPKLEIAARIRGNK